MNVFRQTRVGIFRVVMWHFAFWILLAMLWVGFKIIKMYHAYLVADDPVAKYQAAQQAIRDLREEVAQHPNSADAHYELAMRVNYPDFVEAEKEFKETIALNQNHLGARESLAEIYSYHKRYTAAIRESETIVRLSPCGDTYYRLGLTYASAKQYNQAFSAMRQAIHLTPSNEEYASTLASTYYEAGHISKAKQQWREIAKWHGGKGFWQDQARRWLEAIEHTN